MQLRLFMQSHIDTYCTCSKNSLQVLFACHKSAFPRVKTCHLNDLYKVLCFRKVDRLKCSAAPVICVMEHLQSKVGRGCLFLLFVHASFTLHSAARDRNLMILLWIDGVLPFSQRNWLLSSGNSSIGAETFG